MHTVKVIAAGLLLLAVFVLCGRFLGSGGAAKASLYFIGVWLLVAAGNMIVGVVSAGYGVLEELPVFLVVFAAPSGIALLLRNLLFKS
ncbi:MAG TPA: hypothetical protein VHM25_00355 [Polyangiaceae bacterium]|jgi:hypothetical protein|nr:hypothetical protein [Polyangiaceae bacterium]